VTISSGTTHALRSVHFSSRAYGLIAGDSGTVLSTSDTGHTWTAAPVVTPQNLFAVFSRDRHNGTAVGKDGVILVKDPSSSFRFGDPVWIQQDRTDGHMFDPLGRRVETAPRNSIPVLFAPVRKE
jgi:photosystem II stability/assembly factor-like uncharacterized protein